MDNNSDKSNNKTKLNTNITKYIIKLDNIYTKSRILFRKEKLIDTNIFIQSELSKEIDNLFYQTGQLKSNNIITSTWTYKNKCT